MIRKPILLLMCLALAYSASAEVSEVAPGRYDCQAPAGESRRHGVSSFFGNGRSMAARFRFVSADSQPGSPTAAGMTYRLSTGETASILVMVSPDDQDLLWVGLKPPGSNAMHGMATVRRSRIVELSATMARGAIFARVGNQRGQIYVADAQLDQLEITCQGGRFEIELTRNPRPPRRL